MSLEVALAENTAAMRELISVWTKLSSTGKTITKNVEAGEQTSVTAGNLEIPLAQGRVAEKAEAKKPAATPAAAVTATPTPAAVAPSTPAAESPSEITYDQVSKAITEKVKTNRDHVVATLAKFGAKKGTELKAEQYAEFLEAL